MSWGNPATREARTIGIRKTKATPESKAKLTQRNHERWAKPGEREKLSELNRQRWKDPAYKARMSASIRGRWVNNDAMRQKMSDYKKALWRDPEHRAKHTEAIRIAKSRPDRRAAYSALLRERWKSPAWRKVWLTRQRQYAHDPNIRAQNAERMKVLWADKAWKQRQTSLMQATVKVRSALLREVRAMADATGCFEYRPDQIAAKIGERPEKMDWHMAALERRRKLMLARPQGPATVALYQLL